METISWPKFIGAIFIFAVIASFLVGTVAELREREGEHHYSLRKFSTKQNYGFAFIVFMVIGIMICLIKLAAQLLS